MIVAEPTTQRIANVAHSMAEEVFRGDYASAQYHLKNLRALLSIHSAQGFMDGDDKDEIDRVVDDIDTSLYYGRVRAREEMQRLLDLLVKNSIPLR